MPSTLTTWDAYLKERYVQDKVENLCFTDRPFYAKVPKDPDCSGDQFVLAVTIGNPQGHGATRAFAQTGAQQTGTGANVVGKKFTLPYGDYKDSVEMGDKTIKASRDNAGSLLENKTAEIDGLWEGAADIMATYLYGDSGHSLATGTISTGVITLTNPNDIVNFAVGQILTASANDGTSTGHALIDPSLGYVISINPGAGTLVVSATSGGAAGTPANWTGTMFFFRNGDFGGTATPNIIFTGLAGWIPASDPSSTAFYGLDRTINVTALAGVRLTAAEIIGANLETRLKRLVTRMTGRVGGKGPTDIMLNPESWQDLANALEARGQRDLQDEDQKFGFMKLTLLAGGRRVNVWSDRFCPSGTAFAVRMQNLKLRSILKTPHVLNGDGMEMLRKSTTDDYEFRLVAYPTFGIDAPGWCGRVPTP